MLAGVAIIREFPNFHTWWYTYPDWYPLYMHSLRASVQLVPGIIPGNTRYDTYNPGPAGTRYDSIPGASRRLGNAPAYTWFT